MVSFAPESLLPHPPRNLILSSTSAAETKFPSHQLKASKTDPYRQGCSLLLAPSGHSVCAVQAICKYLALRPVTNEAPLYVFYLKTYLKFFVFYLTRAKVTSILHLLFQCSGVPTELYASHSFRIGAATTAAEAGLPPWLIQTLSGGCPATASHFTSEPLASFRKFPGSWLPLQPPHRVYGTCRKDAALPHLPKSNLKQAVLGT